MRRWLHRVLVAGLLFYTGAATLHAQEPPPQPVPEKTEPQKYERDNSATVIPYTLATIGVIVVMVLVCMPARRD